jgi:hypothetical protein
MALLMKAFDLGLSRTELSPQAIRNLICGSVWSTPTRTSTRHVVACDRQRIWHFDDVMLYRTALERTEDTWCQDEQ